MRSHSANPFAEHLQGNRFRVYFSTRDEENRSSVGWIDLDLAAREVVGISEEPTLTFGENGLFDDSGVSIGCLVRVGSRRYLYYMGWNLAVTVPWRNSIGLAISEGEGPFEKVSSAPVLDRSAADPLTLSYPWVLHEESRWRMWYGSHRSWGHGERQMDHVIRHAESGDGVSWRPSGPPCLESGSDEPVAFSRPCVLRAADHYEMWFSYRGPHYRIGYASSRDGLEWVRDDTHGGLGPSGRGWDAMSVEYGHVIDHKGERYLFYCGDGYGRTGFGLAVFEP